MRAVNETPTIADDGLSVTSFESSSTQEDRSFRLVSLVVDTTLSNQEYSSDRRIPLPVHIIMTDKEGDSESVRRLKEQVAKLETENNMLKNRLDFETKYLSNSLGEETRKLAKASFDLTEEKQKNDHLEEQLRKMEGLKKLRDELEKLKMPDALQNRLNQFLASQVPKAKVPSFCAEDDAMSMVESAGAGTALVQGFKDETYDKMKQWMCTASGVESSLEGIKEAIEAGNWKHLFPQGYDPELDGAEILASFRLFVSSMFIALELVDSTDTVSVFASVLGLSGKQPLSGDESVQRRVQ